ncbi:MAG: hypothetical protein ACTSX4_08705, partial [Candidatus Helarchaeota archaeon]
YVATAWDEIQQIRQEEEEEGIYAKKIEKRKEHLDSIKEDFKSETPVTEKSDSDEFKVKVLKSEKLKENKEEYEEKIIN